MRSAQVFGLSFFDGFTFGGFFTPSRIPGSATTVFATTDSPEMVATLVNEALEAKYSEAELTSQKRVQDKFNSLLRGREDARMRMSGRE